MFEITRECIECKKEVTFRDIINSIDMELNMERYCDDCEGKLKIRDVDFGQK